MRSPCKAGWAAASVVLVAAALAPAAHAAAGSGGQLVTGTVLSVITVTPTPVVLTGLTPGSATPATGSGNVVVNSTDCYTLSVSDPTNGGYLKSLTNAFTARLQWKYGGAFADLTGTAATVAANEPVTAAKTYGLAYQQPLDTQWVPAGAYSTTATFTASTSSC